MNIQDRPIGPGHPTFIVAEMSANHGHDYERAANIVRAAKQAGADAIKLQTYTPQTMTLDNPKGYFQIEGGTLWDGRSLFHVYREGHMPWEWQPRLKRLADDLDIVLFSTPFDAAAVDFLESMAAPAYKVASFEIVDLPLIRRIASTGKPLILSAGMASLEEIEDALNAARGAGATEIALLKCTSLYPAPPEEMNLVTIGDMIQRFGIPVGLSDHSLGITVPLAAVALGACVIEKHFTLSRTEPGPDSSFSLEPNEFRQMVESIREVEKALGKIEYGVSPGQEKSRVFRRSLFVVEEVKKGERFSEKNLKAIRPGNGLSPKHYHEIIGEEASRDIEKGTPLSWEQVSRPSAAENHIGE